MFCSPVTADRGPSPQSHSTPPKTSVQSAHERDIWAQASNVISGRLLATMKKPLHLPKLEMIVQPGLCLRHSMRFGSGVLLSGSRTCTMVCVCVGVMNSFRKLPSDWPTGGLTTYSSVLFQSTRNRWSYTRNSCNSFIGGCAWRRAHQWLQPSPGGCAGTAREPLGAGAGEWPWRWCWACAGPLWDPRRANEKEWCGGVRRGEAAGEGYDMRMKCHDML